jgi:hypothetical protein
MFKHFYRQRVSVWCNWLCCVVYFQMTFNSLKVSELCEVFWLRHTIQISLLKFLLQYQITSAKILPSEQSYFFSLFKKYFTEQYLTAFYFQSLNRMLDSFKHSTVSHVLGFQFNPLRTELNPICNQGNLGSWQNVYTQLWDRITFCIHSVLKHCATNRKNRLSVLSNMGPYIYNATSLVV